MCRLWSSLILRMFVRLSTEIRKKTDIDTDPSPKSKWGSRLCTFFLVGMPGSDFIFLSVNLSSQ